MRNLLVVLVLAALVAPVYGAVDYFRVAGDGSFDTYATSDGSAVEGYTANGSGGAARLGYTKQGLGYVAWAANDTSGVAHTSLGDTSGQTMSQFLTANPGATGQLWLNLNTSSLIGSFALETLRCGNTGLIQEDGGTSTGNTYLTPAANISGATEDYAWKSGPGPWVANGQLTANEVPFIAAGTTSSHYAKQFTAGQNIAFGGGSNLGYDASMAANGGMPWSLACLIGTDWSQGGTSVARANTAGQIVNNDGAGNAVLLSQTNYVGSTNPRNGVVGNWYAITLSSDLLASLANDSATKALLFNNYFAGTTTTGANPAFVTKDQGDGSGAAFLAIATPEPATMVLLALGGLALLRRRSA